MAVLRKKHTVPLKPPRRLKPFTVLFRTSSLLNTAVVLRWNIVCEPNIIISRPGVPLMPPVPFTGKAQMATTLGYRTEVAPL